MTEPSAGLPLAILAGTVATWCGLLPPLFLPVAGGALALVWCLEPCRRRPLPPRR